jgi:DNA-binding transcriptional MerR regulator
MTTRILTLFGEELLPDPPQPRQKPEAKREKAPARERKEQKEVADTPADAAAVTTADAIATTPTTDSVTGIAKDTAGGLSSDGGATTDPDTSAPAPTTTVTAPSTTTSTVKATTAAEVKVRPVRENKEKKKAAGRKPAKPLSKKAATQEDVPAVLAGWQAEKQYYTIGEVAGLFKVNTSHIRFWTNQFELKVRTTRKGDRLYTPDLVQELRMIYHLVKERGFTLAGAKAKLKESKKGELEAVNLRQSLLNMRNHLVELRNRLT